MDTITEVYTANESLQLLWIHYKEKETINLGLTLKELKYLELTVIHEWDTLTTHYKKQLVSNDKLDILSKMSTGVPYFK